MNEEAKGGPRETDLFIYGLHAFAHFRLDSFLDGFGYQLGIGFVHLMLRESAQTYTYI